MSGWRFANPVRLIFEEAVESAVSRIIEERGDPLVLLIAQDWVRGTAFYRALKGRVRRMEAFFDVEDNPSFESCQRAVDLAFRISPEAILAVGGGSAIDTAKAVRAALSRDCRDVPGLLGPAAARKPGALFIAVPTTHGTGSEVTAWATLWDKVRKAKYSLSEPGGYPDFAIYCPALMSGLPLDVALSSSLDALSHAFEAIWNRNRNPVSTRFASEAIVLIVSHLKDLGDRVAPGVRTNLVLASMFSGLAFSNTRTAAAHSISYPLTSHYRIPHGVACALSLYPLLGISRELIQNELEGLFGRLGVSSIEGLWGRVLEGLGGRVPLSLSAWHVPREDIDRIADLSFTKGRMDNQIVDLDRAAVRRILEAIF